MSSIYVPTLGPDDWRRLLADPEKHWKAGNSAKAAALSWEAAQCLPTEVAAIFGDDAQLLLAVPEHKVPLPGGGRASQCDVFALVRAADRTCAVAVEAKVNESFGPTIGEWLDTPTAGRTKRLNFICDLLGTTREPPLTLRYQLFHRTAAAIVEARRFKTDVAAMIVHSFAQDHRWFEDFAAFCAFLGLAATRGEPLRCQVADGQPLILGWATGDAAYLETTAEA